MDPSTASIDPFNLDRDPSRLERGTRQPKLQTDGSPLELGDVIYHSSFLIPGRGFR